MRHRAVLRVGLAAGFVAGGRAGRERYEQMRTLAIRTASQPRVRQAVGRAAAAGDPAKKVGAGAAARAPGAARSRTAPLRNGSFGLRQAGTMTVDPRSGDATPRRFASSPRHPTGHPNGR